MQASVYSSAELVVNTSTVPRERMGEVIRKAQAEKGGKATRVVFAAPGDLLSGDETIAAFDGEVFWDEFTGVTLQIPATLWAVTYEAILAASPRKEGESRAKWEERVRRGTDAEFRAEYKMANPASRSHRVRVVTVG